MGGREFFVRLCFLNKCERSESAPPEKQPASEGLAFQGALISHGHLSPGTSGHLSPAPRGTRDTPSPDWPPGAPEASCKGSRSGWGTWELEVSNKWAQISVLPGPARASVSWAAATSQVVGHKGGEGAAQGARTGCGQDCIPSEGPSCQSSSWQSLGCGFVTAVFAFSVTLANHTCRPLVCEFRERCSAAWGPCAGLSALGRCKLSASG